MDLQLTLSEECPWHILIATNKLKANMIHLIAVKSALSSLRDETENSESGGEMGLTR